LCSSIILLFSHNKICEIHLCRYRKLFLIHYFPHSSCQTRPSLKIPRMLSVRSILSNPPWPAVRIFPVTLNTQPSSDVLASLVCLDFLAHFRQPISSFYAFGRPPNIWEEEECLLIVVYCFLYPISSPANTPRINGGICNSLWMWDIS
jgi:hypothetical protein